MIGLAVDKLLPTFGLLIEAEAEVEAVFGLLLLTEAARSGLIGKLNEENDVAAEL